MSKRTTGSVERIRVAMFETDEADADVRSVVRLSDQFAKVYVGD